MPSERTAAARSSAPPGHGARPSLRALAALALAALAVVATSPSPPTLEGYVIGEVVISGGESIEREFGIHLDEPDNPPSRASLTLALQAASGLERSYTRDVALAFVDASDASGPIRPADQLPVERCARGCDLVYRIRIAAGPAVLPASVVRYEAGVEFQWEGFSYPLDRAQLRLELDGRTAGPVAPAWSILAGVVALALGLVAGPRVDARLPRGRRTWPARGLVVLAIGLIAWIVVGRLGLLLSYGLDRVELSPLLLVGIVDPWSVGLLGILALGVWRGIGRWATDGGWRLGLAGVAFVGLGGLWFAWWSTLDAVVQPLVLGVAFALLGGLGGLVIGQAWRTDARARHDRWWAAASVLAHGVVIAGFAFLTLRFLYDPFVDRPDSVLLAVPAVLIALAWRRWLGGRQGWLMLFDVVIAAVGLLGVYLWFSMSAGFAGSSSRLELDDVAVVIALGASLVALVTSFHEMPAAPTSVSEVEPSARTAAGDASAP